MRPWIQIIKNSFLLGVLIGSGGALTLSAPNFADDGYIRELLETPSDGVISAEIYGKYDSQTIGRSLVQRLRALENKESLVHEGYNMGKGTNILVNFSKNSLEEILTQGFKNIHLTATSRGTLDRGRRAKNEDQLIGARLEPKYQFGEKNSVHLTRPIYGYLELTSAHVPPNVFIRGSTEQYGSLTAVLKEHIKERSTWTWDDSLARPSRANSFDGLRQPPDGGLTSKYLEAQVWGGVDLRDIQEWRVPPGLPNEQLEMLKLTGLPIYQYEASPPADQMMYQRRRGALLFPGSSVRAASAIGHSTGTLPRAEVAALLYKSPLTEASVATLDSNTRFVSPSGRNFKVIGVAYQDGMTRYYSVVDPLSDEKRYLYVPYPESQQGKSAAREMIELATSIRGKGIPSNFQIEERWSDFAIVKGPPSIANAGKDLSLDLQIFGHHWGTDPELLKRADQLNKLFTRLTDEGIALEGLSTRDLCYDQDHWEFTNRTGWQVRKGLSPEEARSVFRLQLENGDWQRYPSSKGWAQEFFGTRTIKPGCDLDSALQKILPP